MLTGDSVTTAQAEAEELGNDPGEAEALPDRKAETVKRGQAEEHQVAMAGDGIKTLPPWRRATSASPWERAPTWPWRAPA